MDPVAACAEILTGASILFPEPGRRVPDDMFTTGLAHLTSGSAN